jgi:hypothetical protein
MLVFCWNSNAIVNILYMLDPAGFFSVEIGLLELKMVLKPGRHVSEAEYLKNNAIFPQNTFNGGGWVGGYFAAAQPLDSYTLELTAIQNIYLYPNSVPSPLHNTFTTLQPSNINRLFLVNSSSKHN